MLRQNHLFRVGVGLALACSVGASLLLAQNTSSGYQKRETSLYRDMFDQTIYYEGTQYLHLERLYSRLAGKKKRALNLNTFDEVPDSTFFTNRHGRNRMSTGELKKGPSLTSGPDPNGQWVITKGKFEGITPGFFIRDQRGDKYLLKFDPVDYIELATGAEIITSRFIHAIGYNVPQYTLVSFKKDKLDIDPNARVIDESGFRRKLTPERLEEFLLFVPETEDGSYRSSASRILTGEILGPMSLQGRRGNDPDDPVDHKDRREIRALQVFSSWLNNFDVRDSNTLDVVEEVEGRNVIRHYLLDFNSSLGGRPGGPQPPHFAHEYLFDYREIFKGLVGLGFWKRAWQKRWDEADRQITNPAVGYFDNRYFNPGGYKTQLPYFPFKDLSRADGFWAAKIIMKFTDDEIREIVSEGKYSDSKARDHIAETLIERRDLIGRYWFKQANPLDDFKLSRQGDGSYELRFEDLAVHYGFEPEGASAYLLDVIGKQGKKGVRLMREETHERSFKINSDWLAQYPSLDILIRTRRQGGKGWSPIVRVEINSDGGNASLAGIYHQD